jgi:pimeloyl-ACP methyl ester carboxylesterase
MKYSNCLLYFISLCLFSMSSAIASDDEREQRMANEIVDTILDGEAIFLEANNHEFLTIYAETDDARGTAVILHGRGFHPDWQDVVKPLRVGLLESGWNTLSVQMPVLEKQAKYYDYVPLFPAALARIEAAIAFARTQLNNNKESDKVVLIAHSCGVHMAMAWSDVESFESIDAFVGIGMGATDYKQPMKKPFPLAKIKVPVLDVYAANDYPAVLKMAPERWRNIKAAGNEKSRQVIVPDAAHYYVDRGDALTSVISDWLDTL